MQANPFLENDTVLRHGDLTSERRTFTGRSSDPRTTLQSATPTRGLGYVGESLPCFEDGILHSFVALISGFAGDM